MSPLQAVRVLGAPGSGKTLLITALVEALRGHNHLVATSAPRPSSDGSEATVITLSNGARVTAERRMRVDELRTLVASMDPRAALLLAESAEGNAPAIELLAPSEEPRTPRAALLAVVSPTPSRHAATFGPEQTTALADLIAVQLLGTTPRVPTPPARRSLLDRLRGR